MDTSLQQRIQSADLTRTEKRIADYFLDHSESLYFMTARDIAQELGVSDTSIIRLCRALGYRGFRELQESQRAELAQVMESGRYVIPRQQVEGKLEQYQNCSPFQCLQLAMETLQETYRKNRPEKFERAAQLLCRASTSSSPASAAFPAPPVIWGCCCPSTSTASPTIAMRTPAAWRASLTTALRTA